MPDTEPALLVDQGGNVRAYDPSDVPRLASLGYIKASDDQVADFKAQEKFGSAGQGAIAGLEGAARGLTLGTSTLAERAFDVPAADIAGRQAAHPLLSGALEAAGIAGGLLIPGLDEVSGPAMAARAGRAATRGLAELAPEAIGVPARLLAGPLQAGTSTAQRILASGAAAGVGSAAEGFFYGAGQVAHEAALGDPNLTAGSAFAAIALTSALNGGLGGVFGSAASALPEAIGRARSAAGDLYGKATGAFGRSVIENAEAGGVAKDTATLMVEHATKIAAFEQAVPGITEDIATAKPEIAKWMLDNQARIAAAASTFPGLGKILSNAQEIGTVQMVLDDFAHVVRDPIKRIELAATQAKSTQAFYDATEDALKTANKELRPAEIGELLSDERPQELSSADTRTLRRQTALEEAEKLKQANAASLSPRAAEKLAAMQSLSPEAQAKLSQQLDRYGLGNLSEEARDKLAAESADLNLNPLGAADVPRKSLSTKTQARLMSELHDLNISPAEPAPLVKPREMTAPEAEAQRLALSLDSAVQEMRAKPGTYPVDRYANRLEEIRDELIRETHGASPREIFDAINDAKQQIDPLAKFGALTPAGERDSTRLVKSLRGGFRDSLENPELWGEAAARQQAFNRAESEYFTARKDWQKTFTKKVGTNAGGEHFRVEPTKVNAWFNAMADARGQGRMEIHDRFIAASREMVNQIEKSAQNAAEKIPLGTVDTTALKSLADKSAEITADARQKMTVSQLVDQLQNGARGIRGSGPITPITGGPAAMRGLGMVAPGFVTSGVKATIGLANASKDVPKAVATLAALERMKQSVASRIDSAASTLVRGGSKAANVGRAEIAAGIASMFGRSAADTRRAYKTATDDVRRLAQPEPMQKALESLTGGWHDHAPKTAQALQIHAARGISYLNQELPQHPKAGPLSPEFEPSVTEMNTWLRKKEAVDNPLSVYKQAAAGTASAEGIAALKATSPALHDQFQSAAIDHMSRAKSVPYRSRLALSALLGQDMDGTLSQASIMHAQAGFQRPPQQGQGSAKAGKITLAQRTMSPLAQVSERENQS